MIKGAIVGSLAMIALYVALQPGSAGAVSDASNVWTKFLNRLMSSDVAGVPQRKAA